MRAALRRTKKKPKRVLKNEATEMLRKASKMLRKG